VLKRPPVTIAMAVGEPRVLIYPALNNVRV
jgi:hypothetical protein